MKRRTKRRTKRWTKHWIKTALPGATALLGVITLTTAATADDGDLPKRPRKPTWTVAHTNQDQTPPPPLPPIRPGWTHTNQDWLPDPDDPPKPGTSNERKTDEREAPPLSRGDIVAPPWSVAPPALDLRQATHRDDPFGARPSVLTHDMLSVLDSDLDAFRSIPRMGRDDPGLRNLRPGAEDFRDGLIVALELPGVPPPSRGTTRPFIQNRVPGPGALSLIGLGALALMGRRRRG